MYRSPINENACCDGSQQALRCVTLKRPLNAGNGPSRGRLRLPQALKQHMDGLRHRVTLPVTAAPVAAAPVTTAPAPMTAAPAPATATAPTPMTSPPAPMAASPAPMSPPPPTPMSSPPLPPPLPPHPFRLPMLHPVALCDSGTGIL